MRLEIRRPKLGLQHNYRPRRLCFTHVCLFHGGGGRGVSRPIPRGDVEGSGLGGSPVHTQGDIEGSDLGGVSRPTPKGVSRFTPGGGLQAHTWGGIPACTEADPPTPADGYCCGRYASYWNAFLLIPCCLKTKMKKIKIKNE